MDSQDAGSQLRALRRDRGISQRQLADGTGLHWSLVQRAERGRDAQLSTWIKLFEGLGYRARFEIEEMCGEAAELLSEESERRQQRRRDGLCAGKRRFY